MAPASVTPRSEAVVGASATSSHRKGIWRMRLLTSSLRGYS